MKALRIGRAPNIRVAILDSLAQFGVEDHFLVVGTNALYAYETAAGVRFPNDAMATMHADLLFDTRSRSEFVEIMKDRGKSFVDLLRKADSSFQRVDAGVSKAVNDRGYEVELLHSMARPKGAPAERLTDAETDLWPVQRPPANGCCPRPASARWWCTSPNREPRRPRVVQEGPSRRSCRDCPPA